MPREVASKVKCRSRDGDLHLEIHSIIINSFDESYAINIFLKLNIKLKITHFLPLFKTTKVVP